MKIDVDEERLVVISDLHLGNPYSLASGKLSSFIDYVIENGFSLCVNGDGLDILQSRFRALASQTIDVLAMIRRLAEHGSRVYYVVGNHDVALEQVLTTWLGDHLSPFLNVRCGDHRIRVEHGHVYDPFYAASPRLYELAGTVAAPLLLGYPDVYKLWTATTWARRRAQKVARHLDEGETPERTAAQMLVDRGFDIVVFGHTHQPERVDLVGGSYLNSGNWLRDSTFVEITHGGAVLRDWDAASATATAWTGHGHR